MADYCDGHLFVKCGRSGPKEEAELHCHIQFRRACTDYDRAYEQVQVDELASNRVFYNNA